MDDCNFLFLKDKKPEFYKRCCFDIDLAIADGKYEDAISNSRKVLEMILKPKDDQDLNKKINSLRNKIPDDIIKYMHDVRQWGNATLHIGARKKLNIKEFTKEHADDIASKLHQITWYQFPNLRFDDESYHIIQGDEKWILEYKGDSNTKEKYIYDLAMKILKKADKEADELDDSLENFKLAQDVEDKEEDINSAKEVIAELLSDMSDSNDDLVEVEEEYEKFDEKFSEIKATKELKLKYEFKENEILDDEQKEASYYPGDKLIIKAGPGAGKTKVLIERIKYLVNGVGVDADSLLIITFTEKAARELKEKLLKEEISQIAVDKMQISTIHAFCRTLLKDYSFSATELIDDNNSERKILFLKKYKEKFGFTGYDYIPDNELRDVIRKFDEYSTFEVDTKKLATYIEETMLNKGRRSEKKFREFVDSKISETGEFPVEEVQNKAKFNQRWKIHKFLAIVNAYDVYKNLLEKEGVFDFNFLQIKARDFLKEHWRDVQYKNILIDEFQDTDKLQMQMFNYLMNGCDTITMVGDPDQCIYGWRGSDVDYFDEIMAKEDFYKVILKTNYRSSKNIVEFNEKFMSNYRLPQEVIPYKDKIGDLYYISNKDEESEAKKIAETIKHLKSTGKINNYSNIALISRSKKREKIEELVQELDKNEIPYIIKGFEDFNDYDEVKSMINLLWYLTEEMKDNELFNIQLFCKDNINKEMFNFKASTLEVLSNVKDPKEFSKLNESQLKDLGITDERDLEIFTRLNNLKKDLHEPEEELTILDAYYKLFNITDYVESKYDILSSGLDESYKNREIMNLALISYKIRCYMDIESRNDIDGFFNFIYDNYESYSSPMNELTDEDKVNILTAHKAKGLEFPVVFVCSLKDKSFPIENIFDEDYKTPLNFLYDKYADIDDEFKLNEIQSQMLYEEERRIIYVALTRAESCLIVSGVEKDELPSKILSQMRNDYPIEELIISNLQKIEDEDDFIQEDLTLSFTSLEDYDKCHHLYNLAHNYHFETPQNEGMYIGTVAHGALNGINTLAAIDKINDDIIDNIIDKAIDSNPSLADNDKFDLIMETVGDYWDDYGSKCKILASEYPFTLLKNENGVKYNVKGQIDLLIQEDPDDDSNMTLLDYKTTVNINNPTNYIKQLHLYQLGIEHNPEFGERDIKRLIIYSLGSNNPIKSTKPDLIVKHKLEKQLSNTAKSIRNNNYRKTKNTHECRQCLLKDLCDIED